MAKLIIDIDVKDIHELKELEQQLNRTDKSTNNLNNSNKKTASSFVSTAAKAAVATAAMYALSRALTKVVSDGFAYNKAMEESKAGLVALAVAVQDKAIPVTERYAKANREATNTLIELQKINAETPHTLDQTNKIYKAMYVSMKNVGATTSDMVELTRSLSIASGAAGIEFNSLLAGVDGLASGTVLANSDLGRFLSSLGLTNEALKESDDVMGLVKNKLEDFKAADTAAVAVSNLTNAWDQLTGELTKELFEKAKEEVNDFSKTLNKLNERLKDYKANVEDIYDIHRLSSVEDAERELQQLTDTYTKLIDRGARIWESTESYNAKVKEQEFLITSLTRKIDRLAISKKKEGEINLSLSAHFKRISVSYLTMSPL